MSREFMALDCFLLARVVGICYICKLRNCLNIVKRFRFKFKQFLRECLDLTFMWMKRINFGKSYV